MRKPRNSSELFHYWAHQVMPEARCGNVSFRGPVLYSYAQPIALLLSNDRVLLSDRQWSITTSSHQSQARSASNHRTHCYAEVIPESLSYFPRAHEDNRKVWLEKAERASAELKNHPRRKKSVALRIGTYVSSYNAYRAFFELEWPELTSEEMLKLVEENAADRAAIQARRAALDREQRRLREIDEANDLALWREHKTDRRSFSKMALRVTKDGTEIETTRYANFPIEHAQNIWPLLCRYMQEKRVYKRNGHTIHLGVYALDSFNADMNGTLVAGCHTVPWEEIESIAAVIGLPPYSNAVVHKTGEEHAQL